MKRAPIGELPGIDGSASMLLPLFRNPAIAAITPNQTREAGRLQVGDGGLALVTRKQSQILFLRNGATRRHSPWSGALMVCRARQHSQCTGWMQKGAA